MEESKIDRVTYAPFILSDEGKYGSLLLSDQHMVDKFHVFEELADDGWSGNGYDWNSIAQVIVSEQLPDLESQIEFDPEAGMFSARGPHSAVAQLAVAMSSAFRDDSILRDLLSRAELD